MIARYTRPEIGAIWTDEARFGAMRDVEVAAAEALDGPTAEDLDAIRAATFTVDAINEREKILDHDTAAFVDVLAASAGPAGRWIHYGLTSSDVVDTGLAFVSGKSLAACRDALKPFCGRLAYPNGVVPVPRKRNGVKVVAYDGGQPPPGAGGE